jgi:hypothetical protein
MHQPSLFDTVAPATEPAPPSARVGGIDFEALWAEMPVEQIPSLLAQSDNPAGRRKIADMIIRNRPDCASRVESAFEALSEVPSREDA